MSLYLLTMDYKFLNKVVEQIVSETEVHHEKNCLPQIKVPYQPKNIIVSQYIHLFSVKLKNTFNQHCKSIYGLNDEEVDYVWNEYELYIKDKVNNG